MTLRRDKRSSANWIRWIIATGLAGILTAVAALPALAESIRVGSEAQVTADDGANLRAKADSSSRLVSVANLGNFVFVIEGPQSSDLGDWYKVEYDGDSGWMLGSSLGPARPREGTSRGNVGGRPSDQTPPTTSQPSASVANVRVGSEAQVATGDGLKLRARPGLEGDVVDVVMGTRYLSILDGPQIFDSGPWFKVDYDGSIGWVMGTYLEPARPREAAAPTGRPDPAPAPAARNDAPKPAPVAAPPPRAEEPRVASNGSVGQAMAQKALGLVGSRYAWGGASPRSGFDCSGLIAYVMGAYGVNPGRTSDAQAGAGRHVNSAEMQPGDIVVFANTYQGGFSHTGIYVGGGRFVHAEDYNTGVIVSSVFGGYWGQHFAGARRPY